MDIDLNAAFSCAISFGFTITRRMSGPDKANHCSKPMQWDLAPHPLLSPCPPEDPAERGSQESPGLQTLSVNTYCLYMFPKEVGHEYFIN